MTRCFPFFASLFPPAGFQLMSAGGPTTPILSKPKKFNGRRTKKKNVFQTDLFMAGAQDLHTPPQTNRVASPPQTIQHAELLVLAMASLAMEQVSQIKDGMKHEHDWRDGCRRCPHRNGKRQMHLLTPQTSYTNAQCVPKSNFYPAIITASKYIFWNKFCWLALRGCLQAEMDQRN